MAYRQFHIAGPFQGIIDNQPAPNKAPAALDDALNFVFRKGRIQSRPRFNNFGAPPDGAILRYGITFESVAKTFHTLGLTTKNAYFVTSGPTYNPLVYPSAINPDFSGTSLPYGVANIINRVYFSNGSRKVCYVDGSIDVKVAGDVQGAARYMMVLANRIVLGYTTEPQQGDVGSIENPYRIRWCVSGNPNDWTGFGSGFTDLLSVPDRITGLASLGRNGYVFRRNGISMVAPTGDFTAPLSDENFSVAPKGVGSIYPYALAVYGNQCAFVSESEIHSFNGVDLTPIGQKAKKKIFADLDQATNSDEVVGFINPNIGLNFDMLSYWLCIPGPNVAWIYLFDEEVWQRFTFIGGGRVTFAGSVSVA